jgi:hypothetical protein
MRVLERSENLFGAFVREARGWRGDPGPLVLKLRTIRTDNAPTRPFQSSTPTDLHIKPGWSLLIANPYTQPGSLGAVCNYSVKGYVLRFLAALLYSRYHHFFTLLLGPNCNK